MFLNTHLKDLINQDKMYLKMSIFLARFELHEYNLAYFIAFFLGNLGLESTKFAISWIMSFLQSCPLYVWYLLEAETKLMKQIKKADETDALITN